MARPLRIEFPGAVYHVTSRGNGQADIYLGKSDRLTFLEILENVCRRHNWRCYAYCLMENHYHLVIETPKGDLAKGMRQINGVYTQAFNRHHSRVGHVFQGRYKAILVDKNAYLLEVVRYVLLNPVRAGMTRNASQWHWSSYRAMLGKTAVPDWLAVDWLLSQFARRQSTARSRFIQFVKEGKDQPQIWSQLTRQIYLGSERFVRRMQNKIATDRDLSEVPQVQWRSRAKPLSYYAHRYQSRQHAMATAYATGAYTMKAIADYFGVHYSTVSRAVKQAESDNQL